MKLIQIPWMNVHEISFVMNYERMDDIKLEFMDDISLMRCPIHVETS
jgi:hypothetical protein